MKLDFPGHGDSFNSFSFFDYGEDISKMIIILYIFLIKSFYENIGIS